MSLKLYLKSLVYHRNIFGSSLKVFGNLWKFSENVWERLSGPWNNFGKPSENHQNGPHQYVYIIERALHISLKIWFYVLMARAISHSCAALTREILFLPLEHEIHIFSLLCNILYMYIIYSLFIFIFTFFLFFFFYFSYNRF